MAWLLNGLSSPDVVKERNAPKISSHPMFEDLQATLVSDCMNHSPIPYSLCTGEEPTTANVHGSANLDAETIAVQEANLQAEIQQVSKTSSKAQELQEFYNSQCIEIETDRYNSIIELKSKYTPDSPEYQQEMAHIHKNHDNQRMHLTQRVTASFQLLKEAEPVSADSSTHGGGGGGSARSKQRTLNPKAVRIMMCWYEKNIENPYPTDAEKEKMASEGGITLAQVKAWFANKRNRSSNTKPKRQKQTMEKKLLSICTELTGGTMHQRPVRAYGDIIKQLSDIINSSPTFGHGMYPNPEHQKVDSTGTVLNVASSSSDFCATTTNSISDGVDVATEGYQGKCVSSALGLDDSDFDFL